MDLQNIEFFLQLAKFEHVSSAAAFLNISQPSLSKRIHTLEKELGIQLFDRIGNRIILNKNGEEFAQYAEKGLGFINAGIQFAKKSVYDTKGTIHIAYSTYAPILVNCIAEYSKLNPYINFEIITYNGVSNVPPEQADFLLNFSAYDAFIPKDSAKKGMFWIPQPLFQECYVLIYGPQTALRISADSFNFSNLKDEAFITMGQDGIFWKDVTMPLCLNAGFFPKLYCQTDEFLVKIKLVQEDLALAVIPESCLQDALAIAPALQYLSLADNPIAKRTISLMRRKKVLMAEAALDFWDFVLDYYSLPADIWE